MTSPLTVSVIVTNYNYGAYVFDAVQSALDQIHPPFEVVVVDDGSTDGSAALLTERFGAHPKVRVIGTKNGGQLSAFKQGFAACSGSVVAFLDADDYWAPDHLQRAVTVLQGQPQIDFVFTNLALVGLATGTWHKETDDREIGVRVLQAYHLQPWIGSPTSALLIRRRLCQKLLDVPDDMSPDWKTRADDCLVYGAGILGGNKYYCAKPTACYRVHGGNRWYGRPEPGAMGLGYLWRVRSLTEFYGQRAGLAVTPPMSVILEFKSLHAPRLADLWFYLRLLHKVPWWPSMHMRQCVAMWVHFVRVKVRSLKG